MKNYIGLLVLMICLACGNEGKQDEQSLSEEITKKATAQIEEKQTGDDIARLDFEAFNSNYLQQKNDTTYVVNFWATWCKPCVEELPAFEKLKKDYENQKVKVILTSLDFPEKVEEQVIPFIKKNNIQSEVVLLDDSDANSWIPKVSEEWSGAIPATVIYNGQQRKFYESSFTYEKLNQELKSFL